MYPETKSSSPPTDRIPQSEQSPSYVGSTQVSKTFAMEGSPMPTEPKSESTSHPTTDAGDDEWELVDEEIVFADCHGVVEADILTPNNPVTFADLDSANPLVQIGPAIFEGRYEDVLGTMVFIEPRAREEDGSVLAELRTPLGPPSSARLSQPSVQLIKSTKCLILDRLHLLRALTVIAVLCMPVATARVSVLATFLYIYPRGTTDITYYGSSMTPNFIVTVIQCRHNVATVSWPLRDINLERGTFDRQTLPKFLTNRATGPRKPPVSETIKGRNGTTISNKGEHLDRWAEYFEQQLSWPPAGTYLEPTGDVEPWTVNMEPPTASEVYDCICSLKRHRASGPDDLPPALFKDGGEILSQRLSDLFDCIWEKESVPDNWGESVIVPIFKIEARSECDNHRRISLTPVVTRLLASLVLRRLMVARETLSREQQAGFRPASDENLVDLEYADDIVLIFEEEEKAQVFLDELTKVIPSFAYRLYLSRLGKPGSTSALMLPTGSMVARRQNIATTAHLFYTYYLAQFYVQGKPLIPWVEQDKNEAQLTLGADELVQSRRSQIGHYSTITYLELQSLVQRTKTSSWLLSDKR
ncbi:protein kinase [Clonorchis sinensis]|uniref:Protein kinase n=1 Tax=Clonorchis sinensis TaxID=79923 RepID=G7YHH3_CLOSI|nr:protein kinase [Clonorchis sinensis]